MDQFCLSYTDTIKKNPEKSKPISFEEIFNKTAFFNENIFS